MEIQLLFTHPHIVPSLYDFLDYESFQQFWLFLFYIKSQWSPKQHCMDFKTICILIYGKHFQLDNVRLSNLWLNCNFHVLFK